MLALELEWSADKGWSATAQDAVQDAFIELSLGRGTIRHAAFRQALDTLPTSALGLADHGKEASRAADRVPPRRVLHAELCEERAPIEELSLAQMRSLSAALVERLLRRRAAVRQAAKVSKQVDSALLRELLGVEEGARFVPVAAVIALLRDAAGAELPARGPSSCSRSSASSASPKSAPSSRRSRSSAASSPRSETAMQRLLRAARGGGVAGGRGEGHAGAAADARHHRRRPPTRRSRSSTRRSLRRRSTG